MNLEGFRADAAHGFDFLVDPVLVVTIEGHVLEVNAAAKAFFGSRLDSGCLAALQGNASEEYARYLRLASGSTAPRPGRFSFAGERRCEQFRTHAARSMRSGPEARIILRLLPLGNDRFAMLDRRVKDLDRRLHDRRRENAALQEALRQNQVLLRELQHRVKNNIQLMMSLIKLAAEGRNTPEVAAVVDTSHGRLRAMAATQEALYQSNEVDVVPARSFLEEVVRGAVAAGGASSALSLSLDDAELSSDEAHCLALIANELITNAAKYAIRDGRGRIAVTFAADGAELSFVVEDDGPGIPPEAAARSSGLALVRGLCRQIGGRLDIGRGNGARCSVQFRSDRRRNDA